MQSALIILLFMLCAHASADGPSGRNVAQFAYGTSYGQCIGYCTKELRVSGDHVSFLAQGAYPAGKVDFPVPGSVRMQRLDQVQTTLVLTGQETEELWRLVWSVRYADLPERVGCPDCLDGGAEWLEFTTADHITMRIVFEKGSPPTALKALSTWCSKLEGRFKTPDDWRRNLPRRGSSR